MIRSKRKLLHFTLVSTVFGVFQGAFHHDEMNRDYYYFAVYQILGMSNSDFRNLYTSVQLSFPLQNEPRVSIHRSSSSLFFPPFWIISRNGLTLTTLINVMLLHSEMQHQKTKAINQ